MKRIALMAIILMAIATNAAFAAKEFAQRFPTGTKLEVYTPNNVPPAPDLSGVFSLNQDPPQTMTGLSDGVLMLTSGVIGTEVLTGTPKRAVTFTFDGNYASPTVGSTASCVMGYDGSFTGWKIIEEAGTSSSIILTIKKNGSAISGTEKPTLSSASSATDTSLTTWTTSFSKGDVIQAYVDSASTGVKYVCSLYAEATT
jgi:hypothetical protein